MEIAASVWIVIYLISICPRDKPKKKGKLQNPADSIPCLIDFKFV
jgi:hypothetical protein